MREFARRAWMVALIITLIGGSILLLWFAFKVVLLFLAAVLLAIFLRTLSNWVSRHTRLSAAWSLTAVIVAFLGTFALAGWLLTTPVSQEVDQLSQELPRALARIQGQLEHYRWGQELLRRAREPSGLFSQAGTILSRAGSIFSITFEGVIDLLVILFCGFYLATEPQLYLEGFLKLLPSDKRPRARAILNRIGTDLQHWLLGQIISMTIIGVLTWLGLYLLGIPLSKVLGLLAGVLDFVPVAGPWVAGILSCLLALLKSPMHAVYVACLFLSLHFFEGEVLIPQVQKHSTRLPPVLTIFAMVLFATLFGFLGLLLATPLLILVLVSIRAMYMENVLGDKG